MFLLNTLLVLNLKVGFNWRLVFHFVGSGAVVSWWGVGINMLKPKSSILMMLGGEALNGILPS